MSPPSARSRSPSATRRVGGPASASRSGGAPIPAARNVDRAILVLKYAALHPKGFTVGEVCEATGLPYNSVWRWLSALELRGFVTKKLESAPSGRKGSGYRFRPRVKLVRM